MEPMMDDISQRVAQLESQLASLKAALNTTGAGSYVPPVTADPQAVAVHAMGQSLTEALSSLAPLRELLDDETVNDILINGPNNVYIERAGKLIRTDVTFPSDSVVFKLAQSIGEQIGRTLNPGRPLLDARLPDGSRVNIIAPPLAVDGTSISIRKFAKFSITLDQMAEQKNVSVQLAELLKVIGACRINVIISGGTGSGKTTMLNAVSQFISNEERVVTIEDAAELRLQQPHVVRLETRPMRLSHNEEEVSIRDLMKNALRMRPDRILVGEVRGAEAFDMMQAMNTGHEGSLTTIHANHPRDALARLENMIAMANLNLTPSAIRAQIASAIHLIVQVSRMRDGRRRVTYISEIVGMENDIITMQDLFTFQTKGEGADGKLVGDFKWSGIVPRFVRRAAYYGEADRLSAALGVKLPKL
jgi:pilus assembly protein CpaF